MKQIVFFISFFSLSIGVGGIILAFLIYLKAKNNLFLLYIFVILMWTVTQFWRVLDLFLYHIIEYNNVLVNIIAKSVAQISLGIFCLLFPILIFKLFREKLSGFKLILFVINASIIAIPAIALIYKYSDLYGISILIFHFIQQVILQMILFYYLAFYMLRKAKKIDNPLVRKFIRIMFVLQMVFYPFMILMFAEGFDFARQYFPFYSIIISSLFYFIINFVWLLFVSKFLYFPEMKIIEEKIDINIFSSLYSISKREKEIIILLIKGLSYKEISDRLFISFETVKTHMKHIYQRGLIECLEFSRL